MEQVHAWRVEKRRYSAHFEYPNGWGREGVFMGYRVDKKEIVYRDRKSSVMLAVNSARKENAAARRIMAKYPGSHPPFYYVEVREVTIIDGGGPAYESEIPEEVL